MSLLTSSALVAIPCLPLVAGVIARLLPAPQAVRISIRAGGLILALVSLLVMAGIVQAWSGALAPGTSPAGLFRFDLVAATMAVLIAFLGVVILRYSGRYLQGDPGQSRFMSWLNLTLASVLAVVLAGNLFVLLGAWIANSLCLHRLLLFYPERPGAVFSARKKFVVSRLGDLALTSAVIILYQKFGTGNLEQIFERIAGGETAGLGLACGLLVICASLKSAQFPFHSWLPDTMETPTPVSALMHAGIINAGGFLVVRTAPLFVHASGALIALALIGTVTAAFGAVVMLAQPSVKRALAYSTIAQMGFMLLQCGLGAFGLALIHLVAHSLYKAHAFLTSGSTVGSVSRRARPLGNGPLVIGLMLSTAITAACAVLLHSDFINAAKLPLLFLIVSGLAMAYGVARALSVGVHWALWICAVTAFVLVTVGLHVLAAAFPSPSITYAPSGLLIIALSGVFAALFLFQALVWRTGHSLIGRRFYVHALNGFYIGTYANRMLTRLWPKQS